MDTETIFWGAAALYVALYIIASIVGAYMVYRIVKRRRSKHVT